MQLTDFVVTPTALNQGESLAASDPPKTHRAAEVTYEDELISDTSPVNYVPMRSGTLQVVCVGPVVRFLSKAMSSRPCSPLKHPQDGEPAT